MRKWMVGIIAAIGIAGFASEAQATDCVKIDSVIDAPFEAWSKPLAPLSVERSSELTLRPSGEIQFKTPPGQSKPGMAGVFAFEVPKAGKYRVALGSAAWVDVVENGKVVKSTSHGHGPVCTSIRKVVDFPLKAGEHWLQLNGSAAPTIKVLIVAAPASR